MSAAHQHPDHILSKSGHTNGFWIRNTKISENPDMTKSWAAFCCPGTYKNIYQLCCGICKARHINEDKS